MRNWRIGLATGWLGWWLLASWPLAGHWTTNPQYAYGWLVLPLALLLAIRRWPTRPTAEEPARWALPLIVAAAALVFPAWLIAQPNPGWRLIPLLLALSAVAGSIGLSARLGGPAWARHFAFPFCFALTAVPWPSVVEEPLVQGLMRFVAGCTVALLNLAGHPAVQRGNLIEVTTGLLGVDEACSGVRSLQAALMAALFLGEFHRLRAGPRGGLVAIAFATAVGTNIVRTSFLSFSAARGGAANADRWHDPAGYTILTVCLVVVALAAEWMRARGASATPPASAERATPRPVRFGWVLCGWFGTVLVCSEMWYYQRPAIALASWTVTPPPGAKVEPLPKATLELLGCDRTSAAQWRDAAHREWTLFFLEWLPSRSRTALLAQVHRPEVCLPSLGLVESGPRRELHLTVGEFALRFQSLHFRDPRGADAFVFYCPWEIVPGKGGRNAAFSDETRFASLRRVWQRERMLGQQVAEFIVRGERSREAAEEALRLELERVLNTRSGP